LEKATYFGSTCHISNKNRSNGHKTYTFAANYEPATSRSNNTVEGWAEGAWRQIKLRMQWQNKICIKNKLQLNPRGAKNAIAYGKKYLYKSK